MIDVSMKFNTLRTASAQGILHASPETISKIRDGKVPKGNVLEVARAAGILAGKNTSQLIVFCHPIPVDLIEIEFELEHDQLRATAFTKTVWKTGIEVEAITAVTVALLNAYDMLKPLDNQMKISGIEVIGKRGGKSTFVDEFENPIRAAVLVISDSTFEGTRKDKSGQIIKSYLSERGLEVPVYQVLPDNMEKISASVKSLADDEKMDLIITTGGTGFGPKDMTPEATIDLLEKQAPGITEAIRKHGKERTPYAMLSRELAGTRGKSLIINLPGSSKGAQESLEALFPGLLHIYPMMRGGGH